MYMFLSMWNYLRNCLEDVILLMAKSKQTATSLPDTWMQCKHCYCVTTTSVCSVCGKKTERKGNK